MSLLKPKQIDLVALATALNIASIARNALSVPSNSLLTYNNVTGVLDYQGYISSRTIYVDKASPKATDTRTSYSKYSRDIPFKTIQGAVNYALPGDLILVLSGHYIENIDLSGTGKVFVIQFEGATVEGDIILTKDSTSANVLIFACYSSFNGQIKTNNLIQSPILIGDNTSTLNTSITTAQGIPNNLVVQSHKRITSANTLYVGGTTVTNKAEVFFKDTEIYSTSPLLFNNGNLQFENVTVIQDSTNTTDSIFLNTGITISAENSKFVSNSGLIYSGTGMCFNNIRNCTFHAGNFCFNYKGGNKLGHFTLCAFSSVNEGIFKFEGTGEGVLYLNKCSAKVLEIDKYIIYNYQFVFGEIEAYDNVHNSGAGFYSGLNPAVYTNNNLSYSRNL